MLRKTLWVGFMMCLIGCAEGNCRINKEHQAEQAKAYRGIASTEENVGVEHIRVFKYDGSEQCGLNKGVQLEVMRKELPENIVVYKQEVKIDGLMHSMRCGASNGRANVYEISKKDLEAAKKAGFKEWIW